MTCDIQQMLYKSVIANVIDYFDIQINQISLKNYCSTDFL